MFHTTDDVALAGNPIDDVIGSSIKYAAIVSAGKLRVFQALEAGPLSSAQLAKAIGCSEQGTQALADVLAAIDYLRLEGGRYSLGRTAERWLGARAERDFTPALLWAYELWNVLWELPQAIRDGKPKQSLWERWAERPEAGRDFSEYMKIKSTLTADAIVRAAPVPAGAKRLLDLGGSHGLHTIAFCKSHPQLNATIMDLPEALRGTSAAARSAGVDGRVALREGDFLKDPIGDGYDVVLLFEIVHNHTPDENRRLLRQVGAALNPGGVVLILEDLKGEQLDQHNAAFSLAMFACSGDRTYAQHEIESWLKTAELASGEVVRLPSSLSLIVGRKPASGR